MSITLQQKLDVINLFKKNDTDKGSTPIQCGILTVRINQLNQHLKTHHKDHSSRRGLLKLVGQRKRLLAYQKQQNNEEYKSLIKQLGIRK